MTVYNKTSLKTFFETGDVPAGQQYADFIDSCVNLAETAQQDMAGPLSVTELVAAQVSAGNITISGSFSAANLGATNLDATNANITNVSAGTINASTVNAVTLNTTGNISASAASVYASAVRVSDGLYGSTAIVSAAGTTQGAAALLTSFINRVAGVADGVTTGVVIAANRTGLVQYVIGGAASANLWPPTGGRINALASNAAFGMAASTQYTILHTESSGYSVK